MLICYRNVIVSGQCWPEAGVCWRLVEVVSLHSQTDQPSQPEGDLSEVNHWVTSECKHQQWLP